MPMTNEDNLGFQKALEILEALPKKEFIEHRYKSKDDECYCAVGAIMHHYGMDELLANKAAIVNKNSGYVGSDLSITALAPVIGNYSTGVAMLTEIPFDVLRYVQKINDNFGGTKEGRYDRVIRLLKHKVASLAGFQVVRIIA
jgi:hypothetical protein